MITLEIAFATDGLNLTLPSLSLGMEEDKSMKSDKAPSRWEERIFYKISGSIIHVFDRQFSGQPGYRALYDDIIDEAPRIKFEAEMADDFVRLIEYCLTSSKDGIVYICTDIQFGPREKIYKPMSQNSFVSYFLRFGLRLNSCVEVHANPRSGH
jgi:hypothetical protein